jgi:hypothetical protein
MEFASEMVINAARAGLKIAQLPIAYHARVGESKLRPVRDGWRHLRFMLLYSPMQVTLIPGALLVLLGLALGGVVAHGSSPLLGHNGDVQALMLGALLALMGIITLALGVYARFASRRQRLTTMAEKLHLAVRADANRADAGLPVAATGRGEGVPGGHSNG